MFPLGDLNAGFFRMFVQNTAIGALILLGGSIAIALWNKFK